MIALLQVPAHAEGVFIPGWMLGMFGALLLILFGIIGYLTKFVVGTFKGLVTDLKTVIDEAVKAFQAFKDDAPKEFVTHPFFELAHRGQKDDIAHAHKRISELREELTEHSKNCPAAIRFGRSLDGG